MDYRLRAVEDVEDLEETEETESNGPLLENSCDPEADETKRTQVPRHRNPVERMRHINHGRGRWPFVLYRNGHVSINQETKTSFGTAHKSFVNKNFTVVFCLELHGAESSF